MENDNVIICSGLSKNYGKNIIYDNLSIDIPEGITGLAQQAITFLVYTIQVLFSFSGNPPKPISFYHYILI